MNKNNIMILLIVIIIIATGSFVSYLLLNDKQTQKQKDFDIDTKLPLSYYQEEKKFIPYEQDFSKLFNTPKNYKETEELTDSNLEKLIDIKNNIPIIENNETIKIPYTKNIFTNNNVIDEEKIKQKIVNSILQSRNTPLTPKNTSFTIPAQQIDYGADKLSNQSEFDKATNEHKLLRTLTANKRIPAILIEPISSDKDGIVTAQIEEDIYSYIGNTILIPKGSQAIGFYTSNNKIGENRLLVLWREILTPQGVNILLTNSNTQDVVGKSGIIGKVDNKYWDRYGLSLTLSTLANSIMLSVNNLTQKVPNPSTQIVLNNTNNNLEQIMGNIIQEQIKIRPTIEILAGSRIFIRPTIHIHFPIPKNNEIMAHYFSDSEM